MKISTDLAYRIDLEQAILGACILEGSALPIVADVLTEKNFTADPGTGYDHTTIFKALISLYPKSPVDLLTVRNALPRHDVYLATLTAKVSSTAHLKQHALILLQLDITEKFRQLISSMISRCGDRLTQVACSEILDSMEPGTDVFEVINKAIMYLTKLAGDETTITQLRDFAALVSSRVANIKQLAATETLLRHLDMLKPNSPDPLTSLAYERLKESLKVVIATGRLDEKTAKLILMI